MNELKKCPFCGYQCDADNGIGGITFFRCLNDSCLAIISFKSALNMKTAIKQFNKRKGD
ncbi:hypothetical protein RCS94_06675 [Orbaceae bacterium ac157xtp]